MRELRNGFLIPRNYKAKIIDAEFEKVRNLPAPGWKKCDKKCKICPFTLDNTDEVTGLASGYNHKIRQPVPCNSENVIYYWKCIKNNCEDYPECEYVGQTKRKFKDRLAEYRDYPKRDVLTEPSGGHFTKRGTMFPT